VSVPLRPLTPAHGEKGDLPQRPGRLPVASGNAGAREVLAPEPPLGRVQRPSGGGEKERKPSWHVLVACLAV
jgi:hypothetical protein